MVSCRASSQFYSRPLQHSHAASRARMHDCADRSDSLLRGACTEAITSPKPWRRATEEKRAIAHLLRRSAARAIATSVRSTRRPQAAQAHHGARAPAQIGHDGLAAGGQHASARGQATRGVRRGAPCAVVCWPPSCAAEGPHRPTPAINSESCVGRHHGKAPVAVSTHEQ